ncbi:spondin domain-containing protein [Glaciecola siphonariae]|uniref:Spondin domain-containing protein n=1 Tax=Glaciecola siphonariae TaxID=521012 RepID=A0ABV9LS03_9ALTE
MKKALLSITALTLLSASALSYADGLRYEVTVTNITKGQTFTPILGATHKKRISFFELGEPASAPLAELAESGNVAPLQEVLDGEASLVGSTAVSPGLLGPGESISFEIEGKRKFRRFSMAAMLIPTNDTFVAINNIRLPSGNATTVFAEAYDAGSEANNELCSSIPGPFCQGEGASPESANDEGFVHIAAGVNGQADLDSAVFDWRSSVAKVEIRRIH